MSMHPWKLVKHLQKRIALDSKAFRYYSIFRALVIVVAIRSLFLQNLESFALCLLSLVLFLLPSFFEEQLKVEIPQLFEIIIYAFIFAAEILGEVDHYYTEIPGWDTMLHTLNGFLCAAIGFSLVDILNRNSKKLSLSPLYLAIVAFCFSMTVGVIWEFFEFTMDQLFGLDMQKDFIVKNISSVTLDPTHSQTPFAINDITRTIVETSSGETYTIEGGYLDIGIIDTMKDLMVNFVGAVAFSVLGYLYEKNREKKSIAQTIAPGLMLRTISDDELKAQNREIEKMEEAKAAADRAKEQEKREKKVARKESWKRRSFR